MELRPGYKRTAVGPIPEDWDLVKLGDFLARKPRYGINAPAVDYSDRLPRYIRITDVTETGNYSHEDAVSVNHPQANSYYLSEGDIVLARTGASVGKSYLYQPEDGPLVFAGFLIQVTPDMGRLSAQYLAAYLQTGSYWNWVKLNSTRSGQPGINGNEYAQLPVPRPPLSEQRAIAAALSDVDALLTGLDALIAKKRDLKQAAMQQLLTGKQRLPGFSGPWEVRRLGDIGSFAKGRGLPKDELSSSGTLLAIPYTAIYTDFDEVIDPLKIDQFTTSGNDAIVIHAPHLLIAGSSNMLENIGKATAFIGYSDVAIGGDIILYKTAANVCFLSYLLSTQAHRKRIIFLSQGSTIRHVYASTFAGYELALPLLPEQAAIAAVLSDMDAELAALDARRDKTRALKQGMMQELLTGRIRLL